MAVQLERRHLYQLYQLAVNLLGLGFGLLHRWHVSTLFENDRHFSHLSELEREMSFRTEMGMYYSYYKTIAESKDFEEGLQRLSHDNISEYGNVIDAGKKYSLLPEYIAGYLYHWAQYLGLISVDQCWQIERGEGMAPVTSCEGLGVPIYFYLEIVWFSTICTATILFNYSVYLSKTVASGFITIMLFFYNHNECTRVQWTPPLRETFAYPMLLFQMYRLTMFVGETGRPHLLKKKFRRSLLAELSFATVGALCSWQFSHFIFTTQVIAILILKWTKVVSHEFYMSFCLLHGWSVVTAISVTNNSTLIFSLYTLLLWSSSILSYTLNKFSRFFNPRIRNAVEIVLTIFCTTTLKSFGSTISEDDSHVFNLLKAKLTDYKDFHTMLYTCSVEFDFLQYRTYEAITKTLLLPTAILAGILAIYFWYRNYKLKGFSECIEPGVAYNGLQTGAFIIMAIFIMRLKLLMNPHLCIIAGSVCAKKYLEKLGLKSKITRSAICVILLASMSYHGLERFKEERGIIGEYNNIEQEELFEWIKNNTPEHAVFAGKMSLMANLMLSTRRAIVNNPYYESKEMRDRTMKVYEVFSRKDAASVYFTLRNMQVGYVVLEESLCLGFANLQPGCQMIDLWDTIDKGTAKSAGKLPLCPLLFKGNAYPFRRAFVNLRYVVLQLDYSYYVEYKPKTTLPLYYQS